MRRLGIRGVSRARARRRTTVPDRAAAAARPDLVRRDFTAPAPNQRWVADFTYVPISTGTVYAAFIVDCFSRFTRLTRLGCAARTAGQQPGRAHRLPHGLWCLVHRNSGTDELAFPPRPARYVRMLGRQPASEYGYSMWTFGVLDTAGADLAQQAVAIGSSADVTYPARNATDGNPVTRWAVGSRAARALAPKALSRPASPACSSS